MNTRTVISLGLLLMACEDRSTDPTQQLPLYEPLSVSSVDPGVAYRTQVVAINGHGFDTLYWRNEVRFPGTITYADSGSTARIWIRVPVNAYTGDVFVKTTLDSAFGPRLYVVSGCPSNVCLVQYDGETITQQQSLAFDDATRTYVSWTAKVTTDTLELRQQFAVGDDSRRVRVLQFRITGTAIPEYIQGWVHFQELASISRIDSIRGVIQIQSCDTSSIVSGMVSSSFFNEPDYIEDFRFWYRFN